jgi:hypothetical protein
VLGAEGGSGALRVKQESSMVAPGAKRPVASGPSEGRWSARGHEAPRGGSGGCATVWLDW